MLRGVRTVYLDLPAQTPDSASIETHAHLKNLPISPHDAVKARILNGIDNAKMCVSIDVKENSGSNLIAAKCQLGWGRGPWAWAVYGRSSSNSTDTPRVLHICCCNPNSNDRMDEQMRAYFALDAISAYAPVTPSHFAQRMMIVLYN